MRPAASAGAIFRVDSMNGVFRASPAESHRAVTLPVGISGLPRRPGPDPQNSESSAPLRRPPKSAAADPYPHSHRAISSAGPVPSRCGSIFGAWRLANRATGKRIGSLRSRRYHRLCRGHVIDLALVHRRVWRRHRPARAHPPAIGWKCHLPVPQKDTPQAFCDCPQVLSFLRPQM